jgi:hypothetical protein
MPNLPAGLTFPPDLSDRIRYDGERRRLVFQGVMSKAEFDRLSALSDDWGYRRPLEELFRKSMPEERARGVLGRVLSTFGL